MQLDPLMNPNPLPKQQLGEDTREFLLLTRAEFDWLRGGEEGDGGFGDPAQREFIPDCRQELYDHAKQLETVVLSLNNQGQLTAKSQRFDRHEMNLEA